MNHSETLSLRQELAIAVILASASLEEARGLIEAWRQDYNTVRPHSSLDNLTPAEFVERERLNTTDPKGLYVPVA